MATTRSSSSARATPAYSMPPTFEDLHERMRREVARLRVKSVSAAAAGEAQAAQDFDIARTNLSALCDEFATWRRAHMEVT